MALPTASNILVTAKLPKLPASWSELTWRQLCDCWACKIRYGGNADVARAAALLSLCELEPADMAEPCYDDTTGEAVYHLTSSITHHPSSITHQTSSIYTVTPRELSQMAQQALPWFSWPYGDPGEEAVKDEKGIVVKEARDPVRGLVNPDFKDAMELPEETIVVVGDRMLTGTEWKAMLQKERHADALHFQLPSMACHSLTWQQYRALQAIAPQLFRDGISNDEAIDWQAQFIAHCLVPARDGKPAAADRFAPPHDFTYDPDRAEQTVAFWRERMASHHPSYIIRHPSSVIHPTSVLFHILFQVYQTALSYYARVFPLLFNGGGKQDPLQDALTGEVRTINAVMKYQNYTKPEDVYAENLPVILSTLNTMAEEAKQIEQMNAKIKHKK